MNDSNEELRELQEELAGARAEVEALQVTVADREARTVHLQDELALARDALSAAQRDVEARGEENDGLRGRAETLESAVRSSADRYRALALERLPEVPAELVTGETIEEIDLSIGRARETVSNVRGHLEKHAQSSRVPIGAPVRSEADASGLSAQEKIARGIEERRAG